MATTKSTTSRSTAAKPRASRPANKSLAARTGRTIKERPYTSAAIATGALPRLPPPQPAPSSFRAATNRCARPATI